ncbi:hypothetical protein [Runella sp.]|jgi:hypothetical protein|uniref:hypothetical protein n=1 Tax=Runella sp. TaxID=1960881 RepID=UPI003019FBDD
MKSKGYITGRVRGQRSGVFLQQIKSPSLHFETDDFMGALLSIDFKDKDSELKLQLLIKTTLRNRRLRRQGSFLSMTVALLDDPPWRL